MSKFLNTDEFNKYIANNYKKLGEGKGFDNYQGEMDGFCDSCNRDVYLRLISKRYYSPNYGVDEKGEPIFIALLTECPRCRRKSFMHSIQIYNEVVVGNDKDGDEIVDFMPELYKLYSLPTRDESYINKDIPKEFESLKITLAEAIFALNHGKNISATIMFRRALQIIAGKILGAKGNTLYHQLEWLKSNTNSLNIDLSILFHDNSSLIKNVGNQGAHPEDDPDLFIFKKEDVEALHDLFLIIINEIFIKPNKLKTIQDELIKNRKLT